VTAPRLPIATNFCTAEVELFDGLSFFLDGNSKITAGNGTYSHPKPNAFSLPAASVDEPYPAHTPRACPGSTTTCRASCYVRGLAKHAPGVYERYRSNAEVLAHVLRSAKDFSRSALLLAAWIEEHAAHGFRWHVSGDVWDEPMHARWIVEVCKLAPAVDFWIYTRTLAAVPSLVTAFNLAVNVSADADNFADAHAVALANGARICYLNSSADDVNLAVLPPGSVIFPDYQFRTRDASGDPTWWNALAPEHKRMICPTDQWGQSEAARCGPCKKCF
jgi:hypothetical protein